MEPTIGEKEFVLNFLAERKKELLARRERFLLPLQELDQELEHLTATMRSIQSPSKIEPIASKTPAERREPLSRRRHSPAAPKEYSRGTAP